LITALHTEYPDAEIHALTSAVGAEILGLNPNIHKIHVYKVGSGIQALWQLSQQLRAESYSLYISIWNHPEMAWVGRLAGIPIRIGDASNPSLRWLYTHTVRQNWENMTVHWTSFNLALLTPLVKAPFSWLSREKGEESKGYRPLQSPIEAQEKVTINPDFGTQKGRALENLSHTKAILNTDAWPPKYPTPVGVHGDPKTEQRIAIAAGDRRNCIRVAIFVGTGGTNFPIPEPAILQFITRLTDAGDYHIFLCGQAATDTLMSLTQPNLSNLIGQTSLPELIAWIRQSDIYVGPDTGPTQIASMMGKPIVFFSPVKPNPPGYWGPLSPAFRIIREEYRCERFCASDGCRRSCFDFLTGDRLYAELCDLREQLHPHLLWTPAESAQVRFKHTIRILIVCHHINEWEIATQTKEALAKHGIQVWVLYRKKRALKDAFLLVKIIKARNINVIHGPFVSGAVMRLVRLIMGIWYKYPSPLWVKSGLVPDTSIKQLLSLYRKLWS
jgi:ADP-heptose:LPS heptosyltransferase